MKNNDQKKPIFNKKAFDNKLKEISNNEHFKRVINFVFPEFSNKLTWLVTATGATIVAIPAIPLLILNFIVTFWNNEFGNFIMLPSVFEVNPWVGASLIAMGLTHNLAYKFLIHKKTENINPHDKNLKEKFISELPTECHLIRLLKEQDFGHSFPSKPISQMDEFLFKWQGAEYEFHDEKIEKASQDFQKTLKILSSKIAVNCHPAYRADRYTAIPNNVLSDFDWPPSLEKTIAEMNELGTQAYKKHQELIKLLTRIN